MKKKILFVDDEPMILQGLRRLLRPMGEEWDMAFAESGVKALSLMAEQPFDAVITDMRMPGMNGAELLAEVRKRHPGTVRIVLSGHADKELIAQCVDVAHQYLSKPCAAEALKETIRNTCAEGEVLIAGKVKDVLGSRGTLPTVPAVFQELEQALGDPDITTQSLGEIIEQDMGMTAKILQVVNSAFFGLRRAVGSASDAIAYLGIDTIKGLVLVHSIFERGKPLATRRLNLEDIWRHSMDTASAARCLALFEGLGRDQTDAAFVGGLLADAGVLVLADHFPEAYDRAAGVLLEEHLLLTTVEQEEFGVNHADVGTWLLGLWGLPAPVIQVVQHHHHPHKLADRGFNPTLAVHAADILVGEQRGNPLFRTARFDSKSLARQGLEDRPGRWRDLLFSGPAEA